MSYIRRFTVGTSALAALLLTFSAYPAFSETFDRAVSAPIRTLLSSLFGLFRFSVTELVLLLLLPALLLLLILAIRTKRPSRLASRLLFLLFCYLALFAVSFAPGLSFRPIEERLGLPADLPTEGDILLSAATLSHLADSPPPPPAEGELSGRVLAAYHALDGRYGIRVNPAAYPKSASTPLFSRLGFFGLYAFPLGEVTLDAGLHGVRYGFTLAHELAHASGFAREEEADLLAFLTCLDSRDPYLVYIGAAAMLDRLLSELYVTSPELWQTVSEGLPPTARDELSEGGDTEDTAAIARPAPDYSKTVRLLCALLRARGVTPEYTVQ